MGLTPSTNKCFQSEYGNNPRTPFQDYFTSYSVGLPSSKYNYFTFGVLGSADDGVPTYDPINRVLDISSGFGAGGFTKVWTPAIPAQFGGLDRAKYIALRSTATTLPSNGDEIVWEVCAAAEQQVGTIPVSMVPGVTNPTSDPRIASAAITCIDPTTWLVFSFYLSNETVFIGYERLPFGKPIFGGIDDYHAFSHLVPVAKRALNDPSNNFAVYAMAFNKSKGHARYLINGQEVYRVEGFGMPISRDHRTADSGGNDQVVTLNTISPGFGTATLLDMLNPIKEAESFEPLSASAASGVVATSIDPLRPLVELGLPVQYIDPIRVNTSTGAALQVGQAPSGGADTFDFLVTADAGTTTRLFGNGALLRMKWAHTHQVTPF